jgi:hypothetical protein
MQDRYAADIGDYVKLALLRHLSEGRRLGIAWYLFPNEGHNSDGRHTAYLMSPERWRDLDTDLFEALSRVVEMGRSTTALQALGILDASYSSETLISADLSASDRAGWRVNWFARLLADLKNADLVFADPDNGLVDDHPLRPRQKNFGKQIPLSEAKQLAFGRTAVIYHHNSRFKGGHDAEVDHWSQQLGKNTIAVRATAFSCRTFFIVNPDALIIERAKSFCEKWANHRVRFHGLES